VKAPLILYVALFSLAAPLAAFALARRRMRGAVAWTLAWCAVTTLLAVVELVAARRGLNNHWVVYVGTPICASLVLWTLSLWQRHPVARLTLRVAIPLLLIAALVLTRVAENTKTFSSLVEPLTSLLALAAAAWTLVSLAATETEPLLAQSWLWICGGMAVYFASLATVGPFSKLVLHDDQVLVVRAYEVQSVLNILAALAIAWGVWRAPRT
jgi:hypothetical protein